MGLNFRGISNLVRKLGPKLVEWASLKGEPEFIGSGTKGSAYRFGDKVLKITNDKKEAESASYLKSVGNTHPNIYHIFNVGQYKLGDEFDLDSGVIVYFIVYEYLDDPSGTVSEMVGLYGAALGHIDEVIDIFYDNFGDDAGDEEWVMFIKNKMGEPNPEQNKYFFQAFSAAKFLWDNNIFNEDGGAWNDWHEGNIGMRGDELVLFDIGYSNSPKGDIDVLESLIREMIMEMQNAK